MLCIYSANPRSNQWMSKCSGYLQCVWDTAPASIVSFGCSRTMRHTAESLLGNTLWDCFSRSHALNGPLSTFSVLVKLAILICCRTSLMASRYRLVGQFPARFVSVHWTNIKWYEVTLTCYIFVCLQLLQFQTVLFRPSPASFTPSSGQTNVMEMVNHSEG